jgi:metal-sulfur cluster biosynthetic enzyme
MLNTDAIREAIRKEVIDPEIKINVVDMGLIYDIKEEGETVVVVMTLTSMGCPAGPQLLQAVHDSAERIAMRPVRVDLTWEPAWNQGMLSQDAKDELGIP